MIENKVNLLVRNSNNLENVKSSFLAGVFKRCNALTLTLKGLEADVDKINNCIDIIKNNSSALSNFRGNNLLTTAVNLSILDNPEESFNEFIIIYEKLKKHFYNNEFLVLASQIIYNYKNERSVDEIVVDTRKVYDLMKEKHVFLTGQEDIGSAALIATTCNDLNITFTDMERCYSILRKNGFWSGNNLQALTHILSLFEGTSEEKCNKIILLNNVLKRSTTHIDGYSLPILGVVALTTSDYDKFSKDLESVNKILKKQHGFGNFSLGSSLRNIISASLICVDSLESYKDSLSYKVIETTKNISLNIVMIMQIAAASAATTASIAASTSSS